MPNDLENDVDTKPKVDHIKLAGYQRAISNFVNIKRFLGAYPMHSAWQSPPAARGCAPQPDGRLIRGERGSACA